MSNAEFISPDIHCQKCAGRVKEALSKHAGIAGVDVDPSKQLVRVQFDEDKIGRAQIAEALSAAGYTPQMQ
jgi:copper chaperone CopZ